MSVEQLGYSIVRNVIGAERLQELIVETERLIAREGSSCLRHIRAKSDMFDELALSSELRTLLPPSKVEMRPVRSILFDKNEKENWPVAWHQDTTIAVRQKIDSPAYQAWSVKDGIVHVRPPNSLLDQMWTLRIHLDDTDETNGCLRVIPNSHRLGIIPTQSVSEVVRSSTESNCVSCAGDVLVMSPLILHASKRASIISRRRVLHFEYAPKNALEDSNGLEWYE